jgi:hypothetical protein
MLQQATFLMTPSILAVSSWLAGRLKKNPDQESTSGDERNKPKSVSEA